MLLLLPLSHSFIHKLRNSSLHPLLLYKQRKGPSGGQSYAQFSTLAQHDWESAILQEPRFRLPLGVGGNVEDSSYLGLFSRYCLASLSMWDKMMRCPWWHQIQEDIVVAEAKDPPTTAPPSGSHESPTTLNGRRGGMRSDSYWRIMRVAHT